MMEYLKLRDPACVHQALSDFEICFPHLKEKIPDLFRYAEKLSDYAEVYLMSEDNLSAGITCFYANDSVNHIGYIALIGVKSSFRNSGLGKKLILFTEDRMLEKGMTSVRLEVDSDNHHAIGFYEHMGYKPEIETENGFYMIKEICL